MSDNENSLRSRRSVNKKKSDNRDLLNQIQNAKKSGRNLKQDTKIEDVYDIVDENTYAELVEKRLQDSFIEDDLDYHDTGKELFDESDEDEYEMEKNSLKRKKSIKINKSSKKAKAKNVDEQDLLKTAKGIKDFIGKSATINKSINKNSKDDLMDLLTEINKKGNPKVDCENPFLSKEKPVKFDINKPRPDTPMISKSFVSKNKIESILVNKKEKIIDKIPVTPIDDKSNTKTKLMILNNHDFDDIGSMDISDLEFPELVELEIADSFPVTAQQEPIDMVKSITESIWLNEEEELENDFRKIDNQFEDLDKSSAKRIYWLDAYYDRKIDGVVFLFGKMFDSTKNSFVNTCVRVFGLERRLYFLPSPGYDIQDVHTELRSLFSQYNIDTFRCKEMTKKYAFQFVDVPDEADYLMVQYDCKFPELPQSFSGKTFSRVFGTNTSCLETLILDLKLKGPCWLNFESLAPVKNSFSCCQLNFEVKGIKGISLGKGAIPPIIVMSLNVKTVVNKNTNSNEIVSIGCLVHNAVYFDQPPPSKVFQNHFTILAPPKDNIMPYDFKKKLVEWGPRYSEFVQEESNERSLINNFLAKLQCLDPDFIVGHSVLGYQIEILLQRCLALNIKFWYKLGRLKRSLVLPKITGKMSGWIERMATAGRIICDTAVSARELVKCRSYELHDLVKEILPEKSHGLQSSKSIGDLSDLFMSSANVKTLIDLTMDEAASNLCIMHELQILPLAVEITTICGNLLSRTLSAGKSERNEYLLLHAFTEQEYLVPDKIINTQIDSKTEVHHDEAGDQDAVNYSKRKPTFLGGLVLEPKRGFYENFILLMDFNSLYPSIIRQFNICFTTIRRQDYLRSQGDASAKDGMDFDGQQMEVLVNLCGSAINKPEGILPREITKLVDQRRRVKSLLNAPNLTKEKKMQYNIRQLALKITANSMYGCLGFSHSRFQATQLAALVTFRGREILMKTKDLVNSGAINFNKGTGAGGNLILDIIYGDTDSIMINTGINNVGLYDQVLKIGQRIKEEVNKIHDKIQLDIDGVFRRMLLLNKKKYAALTVVSKNASTGQLVTKQELKGLDVVRRDWCKLAVEVGKCILTKILEEELSPEDLTESIHSYLKSISENVKSGKIDLDKFVITKALTRNPENYSNAQGQSHVQVALRLNSSGTVKQFRAKDTVEYVICVDGTSQGYTQRAYSPKEIYDSIKTGEKRLTVDCNYYLAHQLHPVISRLVENIEGISIATVAEHLGLDPKVYTSRNLMNSRDLETETEELAINGVNRYKDCKPLVITCAKCSSKTAIDYQMETKRLWNCESCNSELISSIVDATRISKDLMVVIRRLLRIYYSSIFICQELECGYLFKDLPKSINKFGEFICPRCSKGVAKPLISHSQLYYQISYYRFLFSTIETLPKRYCDVLDILRKEMEAILKRSEFSLVKFDQIFSSLMRSKLHLAECN